MLILPPILDLTPQQCYSTGHPPAGLTPLTSRQVRRLTPPPAPKPSALPPPRPLNDEELAPPIPPELPSGVSPRTHHLQQL